MNDYDRKLNHRWQLSTQRAEREIKSMKTLIDSDLHHIFLSLEVEEKLGNYYFDNFKKWSGE